MSTFDQLDLEGRAALLGVTPRQYVALAQSDPRIVRPPSLATPGAVARLRRWLDAGSPTARLEARLEFCGSDEVRAIVLEVLQHVPAPVAWHAVEWVGWVEVGRRAIGWQGYGPEQRSPEGDRPHLIGLCGAHDDDDLRSVCTHELAHSWTRAISPRGVGHPMSSREWNARLIVAARMSGETPEQFVRMQFDRERLADDLGRIWLSGYQRQYVDDDMTVMRRFRDEQTAATGLADEIEREIEGAA